MQSVVSNVAFRFLRIQAHRIVTGRALKVHDELGAFDAASVTEMSSWSSASFILFAMRVAQATHAIRITILGDIAFSHTVGPVLGVSTFGAISGTLRNKYKIFQWVITLRYLSSKHTQSNCISQTTKS
jgi:hypothetical protein